MRYIIVAAMLLVTPALAGDEPRKINFQVVLQDADGHDITECADASDKDCAVKRPMTLGMFAMRALAAPEANLSPEDSLKRGQLALGVYRSEGATLTAEEIVIIKKAIAKNFSPLVVVRAFAVLDPAASK